jgi:hypothetical protein
VGFSGEADMLGLRIVGLVVLVAALLAGSILALTIFGHLFVLLLLLIATIFWIAMIVAVLIDEPTAMEKLL